MSADDFDFSAPQPESFETAAPVFPRNEVSVVPRVRAESNDVAAPRAAGVAIGGRMLPNSTEAEEFLLSCCLLDGADVVARCLEAGIEVSTFYDPKHGIVYDCILSVHARRLPVSIDIVAQELQQTKQLAQIGGYAFLTQVTSRIPTTAQASYFIEKVREQSILRNLIRSSTSVVEQCYNYSGQGTDIDDFLKEQAARVSCSANGYAAPVADLLAREFNIKKRAPKPFPIFKVGETTICTPGNLTAIYALPKDGKTALISAFLAATICRPEMARDCLGISGPNYGAAAVGHIDTEQSRFDFEEKAMMTALRRVKIEEPPKWLRSFHFTGMEARKGVEGIVRVLKMLKRDHGRIQCLLLDGIADFVTSPNNEEECYELIRLLHGLAIEYECAIVCILHLNPAGKDKVDKGRGHLGSQLERKAESNLTLKKDAETEITTLIGEGRQRNGPIAKDKAPSFRWDHDAQMHISCGAPKKAEPVRSRASNVSFAELKRIFPPHDQAPKRIKELYRVAVQSVPIKGESAFYDLLKSWEIDGLVQQAELTGGMGWRLGV